MKADEFNRLLRRIGTDKKAIAQLYKFFYPKLIDDLKSEFGQVLAEDAVQEFFLKLITDGACTDYVEFPATWIFRCCENIAKRKYSECYRDKPLEEDDVIVQLDSFEEKYEVLYKQVARLDDVSCEIIHLCYWKGYNLSEIAIKLNLSPAAVRQKHSRAVKKLRSKNLL